jgi:hypothetical protein
MSHYMCLIEQYVLVLLDQQVTTNGLYNKRTSSLRPLLDISCSTALVKSWRMDARGTQHKFSVWSSCLALPLLKIQTHKLSNPDRMQGFQCMNICFEGLLVYFGKSSKTFTTREQQKRFLPNESLYVFNRTVCACVTGPTRGHEWGL